MQKIAAAALAALIRAALTILTVPSLARRSFATRLALLASVGIVVLVVANGLSRPVATTASQPHPPITALTDDAFRSISAATGLRAPVTVTFSEAMDPASVAAALTISPPTLVRTSWSTTGTVLTVSPISHWATGAYYTLTVTPGALDATGRPMSSAVHAAFVTRPATSVRIVTMQSPGDVAARPTAFRITFDHAVAAAAVEAALQMSTAMTGTLVADSGHPDVLPDVATSFMFKPSALAPGTSYALSIGAVVDTDGAPVDVPAAASFTTPAAPRVERFRPADGTNDIPGAAALSVRFSAPMDPSSTRSAVTVTANGSAVRGSYQFAESNRVVVFRPTAALPAGATIVVTVAVTASSAEGVPLTAAARATLHTVAKPVVRAPAPTVRPTSTPGPTSTPRPSGGGAVGGGSWGAVETYYLGLMNCTRSGGIVTSTGSCSSPGGRSVAPLWIDAGISSKVTRPYAKQLADSNLCTHFSGGNPGDRLRAAGYTSWTWAENIGCQSGDPYAVALRSQLFFQAEAPTNGGHYVNLMNGAYDRVGIGVWVTSGRVRLVIDFYHPL